LNLIQRFSAVSIALAAPAALAGTSATPFSNPADPARWYQPLETPRAKHDNAMTEARNALAEALRDCRADAQRKACEAKARDQYQKDAAHARDFLQPNRQFG
jgi:hypothetical protein